MVKLYALFWQEGLFCESAKSKLFIKRTEAERYIQNIKHIPHSEIVEVELKK